MEKPSFAALQSVQDDALPPEPVPRLQSCLMDRFGFVSEEGVKTLHHSFRGPALNDLPDLVGEADRDELLQRRDGKIE